MTVEEPCRHDKGVEVHQGEVYCFHCGEHLGKAIRPKKLQQFIKNSVTFEPIAQKVAKEEGLGELSKDEIEWLRYVVLKSLNEPKRGVFGTAFSQKGCEEIRKHAKTFFERMSEYEDSEGEWKTDDDEKINSLLEEPLVSVDVVLGVYAKTEAQRNQKLTEWFKNLLKNTSWERVGLLNFTGFEKWRKEKTREFEALLGATEPFSVKASPKTEMKK